MQTYKNNHTMEIIRENDQALQRRRILLREWGVFAILCTFLTLINWITMPHYWWVLWIIGGWGTGMLLRTLNLLTRTDKDPNA